jgi:iron-sulfur cluster repair protein YtfE (RIC family)
VHALALRRSGSPETARSFLAYLQNELLGHMADEEEALLPRCAFVSLEGASRIVAEHGELKRQAARLEQDLGGGGDLRPALRALGDLLHDHVRFEERVFFEAVQRELEAAALEETGLAIDAHREARGKRPGCAVRS